LYDNEESPITGHGLKDPKSGETAPSRVGRWKGLAGPLRRRISVSSYTEAELDDFATPLSIHLERSAQAKSVDRIGWIAEQMDAECVVIYDSYLQWTALLQTFIIERRGEAAHDEALREMGGHAFREFVEAYRDQSVKARVEMLARRLRASGSTFDVIEEADRVRFRLTSWGAARLNRPIAERSTDNRRITYASYGAYAAPTNLATLKAASPLTKGLTGLPCFIASEILFLEIIPTDMLGKPIAVIEADGDVDGIVHLDIDKTGLPDARSFDRIGYAAPRDPVEPRATGLLFSAEDLDRLATPLSIQVREAAAAQDWDRLLAISADMDAELVGAKDPLGILINGLLTWIARHLGEAAAIEALERTADFVMSPYLDWVSNVSPIDAIPMWAMVWRAHGSTFWITEEEDRFVLRGRPLGACARMAASRYEPEVRRISPSRVRYPTFGSGEAPLCAHKLREPHPLNHFTPGFPVYSAHCTMLHEVFPIDRIGRPLWVEEHPLDDPDGDTVHYHYKDPKGWPEPFYTRVGRIKP